MADYTINFLIWWYFFKVPDFAKYTFRKFIFMLYKTKGLPMLVNLFKPLYGDTSNIGILIGFPVRLIWGITGLIISTIYIVPFFCTLIILFFIPLIPIIQLINFLIR